MNETLEDILYFFKRELKNLRDVFYRTPINFIRNIIDYRKFLMKNTWWDSHFYFLMLKVKLETDLKYYRKYHWNANPEPIIESMEECLKIVNFYLEDKFFDFAYKEHDRKYGKLKFDLSGNGRLFLERKNMIDATEEEKEIERVDFLQCSRNEWEMEQATVNKFFAVMSKNILSWWD